MRFSLRVICTNSLQMNTGLVLQVELNSQLIYYLFNVPDAFQTIAGINKLSFHKIRTIFLSNLSPECFSGLPGLYLSAGANIKQELSQMNNFGFTVLGPKGLKNKIGKCYPFMGSMDYIRAIELTLKDANLQSQNFGMEQFYLNEPVYLQGLCNYENNKYVSNKTLINQNDKVLHQLSDYTLIYEDEYLKVYPLELINHNQEKCYSYFCQSKNISRTFSIEKAKQIKNLIPKLHYKLLVDGKNVCLDDGSIITPDQVCFPQNKFQCFAIIFMPDESFCQNFINNFKNSIFQQFSQFQNSEMVTIYHSVPKSVMENQLYQNLFTDKNIKHIFDCVEINIPSINKPKCTYYLERLKIICPLLFPISYKNQQNQTDQFNLKNYMDNLFQSSSQIFESIKNKIQNDNLKQNIYQSQNQLVFEIYPINQQGLYYNYNQNIFQQEYMQKLQDQQNLEQKVQKYIQQFGNGELQQINKQNISIQLFKNEPQILFLGTISMKPTQYRGVSAIYLLHKNYGILMDCGEGSYSQIFDHFSGQIELINELILKTKIIFITHQHGDHQLGTLKILVERDRLFNSFDNENKIYIVTPSTMMSWMEDFINSSLKFKQMVVLVPAQNLNPENCYYYQEVKNNQQPNILFDKKDLRVKVSTCKKMKIDEIDIKIQNFKPLCEKSQEMQEIIQKKMNIDRLLSIEVDHCYQTYACLIISSDFGEGKKIIYSGDTRPCQNFINYAQKAQLMIHEATLGAGMEEDAKLKKHTTTTEALELIKIIQPWRSILTHFSSRYQKLPEIFDQHIDLKCMIAFDHLRLQLSDFQWAYLYLNIFKQFLEDEQEIQSKDEEIINQIDKKQKKKKKFEKQ